MSAGLMEWTTTTKPGRSMPTVTVNAAFMREIKEASEELWQLLGEMTYMSAHPRSIRQHPQRSVELLQQLQDQLGMYFTLEEYYGYFESPAFVDHRYSENASALRAEHQSMYREVCAIVDRAERLLDQRRWASLAHHISIRVAAFYEQLIAHEANEQNLMLGANGETP